LALWEIAVLLDMSEELKPAEGGGGNGPDAFKARSRELLRKRMAHSKGEGEKPETAPAPPTTIAQMSKYIQSK